MPEIIKHYKETDLIYKYERVKYDEVAEDWEVLGVSYFDDPNVASKKADDKGEERYRFLYCLTRDEVEEDSREDFRKATRDLLKKEVGPFINKRDLSPEYASLQRQGRRPKWDKRMSSSEYIRTHLDDDIIEDVNLVRRLSYLVSRYHKGLNWESDERGLEQALEIANIKFTLRHKGGSEYLHTLECINNNQNATGHQVSVRVQTIALWGGGVFFSGTLGPEQRERYKDDTDAFIQAVRKWCEVNIVARGGSYVANIDHHKDGTPHAHIVSSIQIELNAWRESFGVQCRAERIRTDGLGTLSRYISKILTNHAIKDSALGFRPWWSKDLAGIKQPMTRGQFREFVSSKYERKKSQGVKKADVVLPRKRVDRQPRVPRQLDIFQATLFNLSREGYQGALLEAPRRRQ